MNDPWLTTPDGHDPTDGLGIDVRGYWAHVLRTRWVKVAAALVLVVGLVLVLAACDTSPGTVKGRYTSVLGGRTHYWLEVKHDQSGKTLDEDVTSIAYLGCDDGDRWPECAR